ncbi:MAG: hypothetical protein ACPHK8_00890 [Thermoplasmatota archaeon]
MLYKKSNQIMLFFLLSLAFNPAGSAQVGDASVLPNPEDCVNNGVLIQISASGSEYGCEGVCTNNGIVIQLSPRANHSCGECANNGIIVAGPGQGCYRDSLPMICLQETCTPSNPCNHHCQASESEEKICTLYLYLSRPEVYCAHAEDCAILSNTGCWTVRLACTLGHNQTRVVEEAKRFGIHCMTWDTMPTPRLGESG